MPIKPPMHLTHSMAVRAHKLRLAQFGNEKVMRPIKHVGDVGDLYAANVVEVHGVGREGISAIGAGSLFELIDEMLVDAALTGHDRRVEEFEMPEQPKLQMNQGAINEADFATVAAFIREKIVDRENERLQRACFGYVPQTLESRLADLEARLAAFEAREAARNNPSPIFLYSSGSSLNEAELEAVERLKLPEELRPGKVRL